MDYKEQLKMNEKLRKEIEKLERERIKFLKVSMNAQIKLAELRSKIASKRREYKIVAFRRSPLDIERKRRIVEEVGRCEECGSNEDLTIHHKKSLSQGGTHSRRNLKVLCLECHQKYHPIDKRAIVKLQ